jgi:hypothetical protein
LYDFTGSVTGNAAGGKLVDNLYKEKYMWKRSIFKKMLLAAGILSVGFLHAISAQAVEFKGVVGIGFDLGGDVLLGGSYADGSTWEVKANQGFMFNGGVAMVTGNFETQATVGYKFGGPTAKNGSVSFDVVPVELMEFYRAGTVRMGLGLIYHSRPQLTVDIAGSPLNGTYSFDDAMGTVAQIGWVPPGTPSFSIDLRYTSVKFKQKNVANAQEISGNVAGLYASFYF